jgi:hypothetical protein
MQSQGLATAIILSGLFIGTAFVVLVAFECGLRIGRWRSQRPDPEPQLPARMIISSVLGLLAFILGFTFGVAVSHFDARNQALDHEAISISTAYHRADLLPEPERTKIRELLREYVDLRMGDASAVNMGEIVARIRGIQEQIWSQAVATQKATTAPPGSTIVLQSLNDVIDVSAERVLRNMSSRIPTGVWAILYAMTIISMAAAGYHSGLAGARGRSLASLAYALVFAGVIVMIADVDTPGFGQFRESKQALIELRARLSGFNYDPN